MARSTALLLATLLWMTPPGARAFQASGAGIFSGEREYIVDTWNTDNRFNPFSIYTINQTPEGYLWLATDGGLVKFDGRDFTEYTSGIIPGLRSNDITGMTVTPDGRLWLGTWAGSIFCRTDGLFRSVRTGIDSSDDPQIYTLHADRRGGLWMGDRLGLARILGDSVAHIRLPEGIAHEVQCIAEGPDSALWFTMGGRVAELLRGDSVVVIKKLARSIFATVLKTLADGTVWIGSTNGLLELRDGEVRAVRGFPGYWVQAIHTDRSGTVWIATTENGLFRYAGGEFRQLTVRDGLPTNRVRTIFEDREGTLWFGTRGGGFFRLKKPVVHIINAGVNGEGGQVTTVREIGSDSLLIGTRDRGLILRTGSNSATLGTAAALGSGLIRCTVIDPEGALWIGTSERTGRVVRGSVPWGSSIIHPVPDHGHPVYNVRSIVGDHAGTAWFGSHNMGILRYDGGTGSVTTLTKKSDALFRVRVLFRRKNGDLLAGTREGLGVVADTGIVVPPAWYQAGIREVFALHEDRDSTLWVGTYSQGLFRIRGDRVTRYTVGDGLFNNVVYAILEDDRGRLWMSCNMGIFYVTKEDLEAFASGRLRLIRSVSLGLRDGLRSVECNGGSEPSAWKTRDGRLLFATMDGVAVVDPAAFVPDTHRVSVRVERVQVDGSDIKEPGTLDLSPGVKKIEFFFTAIEFNRSSDIEFQVRLDGFDEGWVDRGTRRSVSYTSLGNGDYVMRLRARKHDAPWPEEATVIPFSIEPYLWDRWSARAAAGIVAVAAVLWGVKKRERRILRDAERDREARLKISELESRALRSQINPHFIFNSLNGIRAAVLENRTRAASDYLEKFSVLMRNILENSDRHAVSLEREIETLRLYIELEQLRFEEPFRYSIDVGRSLDRKTLMVPPMLIQPVVENAIWHGLSTKEGDKFLSVSFSGDGHYVRCSVEDNGVGRAGTAGRDGKHALPHKPRGMQITRDLMEAFRAGSGKDARIEVTDLHDRNGSPAGTRVDLIIPANP